VHMPLNSTAFDHGSQPGQFKCGVGLVSFIRWAEIVASFELFTSGWKYSIGHDGYLAIP
jgi:hypothetical protein